MELLGLTAPIVTYLVVLLRYCMSTDWFLTKVAPKFEEKEHTMGKNMGRKHVQNIKMQKEVRFRKTSGGIVQKINVNFYLVEILVGKSDDQKTIRAV